MGSMGSRRGSVIRVAGTNTRINLWRSAAPTITLIIYYPIPNPTDLSRSGFPFLFYALVIYVPHPAYN